VREFVVMQNKKIIKKISGMLMSLVRSIRESEQTDDQSSGFYYRVSPVGKTYAFSPNDQMALRDAARKLVPLLDEYTLDECRERLEGMVVEEKDNNLEYLSKIKNIQNKLNDFLSKIASGGQEWEVVFAVKGIAHNQPPFKVGVCVFQIMDQEHFDLWGRRYSTGHYVPSDNAVVFPDWQRKNAMMLNQTVTVVRVRGVDHHHARSKARRRVEEAIDLLRYGQLVIPAFSDQMFPEVGLFNWQYLNDYIFSICVDQLGVVTNLSGQGPCNSFTFNEQAPGWGELDRLLQLDPSLRSEIDIRMISALRWIGLAAIAPNAPVRLVCLITGLETLLIDRSEILGKKNKLIRRISKLISESDSERESWMNRVADLYQTRSECVHGGLLDVERETGDLCVKVLSNTLFGITKIIDKSKIKTVKNLIENLDPVISEDIKNKWIKESYYYRYLNENKGVDNRFQHWLDAEREYKIKHL
jgi:hypothetical protein